MFNAFFAGSSPVTKGVLASTLVASAFLHARDPDGNFNVTLGKLLSTVPALVYF